MSKNVALFVDVANLYYSARGQDVDVDYVALLKAATKGRDLIRAYAYSGLDPENENQRKFIDFLGKNGYKVLTKDIRKFGDGRVKANLDIELVVDLFRLADRMDIAVIVSGDGDFAPAIRALQDKGVRCEVISFRPNTSSDLIAVADEFIDVMKIAGIGRGSKEARAQRGMSAPEMPAKEVVPEFGFREASPSVAQAALAALREGTGDGAPRARGRTTRTGRARPPEASGADADEDAAPTLTEADLAATAEGDGRKRRRRRGGRGRGRRTRAAEGEAQPIGEERPGEIGWVELDDLSQLADLEGIDVGAEREYSFEEADAATLAELGLATEPEPVVPPEAAAKEPPAAEAKPARGRRTTSRKAPAAPEGAASEPAATEPASTAEPGEDEKKPARRRRTTKKADAEPQPDAPTEAPAGEKPKRTRSRSAASGGGDEASAPSATGAMRRSRKKAEQPADSPSEPSAPGSDEGQGIWERFRSARGGSRSS